MGTIIVIIFVDIIFNSPTRYGLIFNKEDQEGTIPSPPINAVSSSIPSTELVLTNLAACICKKININKINHLYVLEGLL